MFIETSFSETTLAGLVVARRQLNQPKVFHQHSTINISFLRNESKVIGRSQQPR